MSTLLQLGSNLPHTHKISKTVSPTLSLCGPLGPPRQLLPKMSSWAVPTEIHPEAWQMASLCFYFFLSPHIQMIEFCQFFLSIMSFGNVSFPLPQESLSRHLCLRHIYPKWLPKGNPCPLPSILYPIATISFMDHSPPFLIIHYDRSCFLVLTVTLHPTLSDCHISFPLFTLHLLLSPCLDLLSQSSLSA